MYINTLSAIKAELNRFDMWLLDGKVLIDDPAKIIKLVYFFQSCKADFYSLTVCHIIR
jgi:hypothetical protein